MEIKFDGILKQAVPLILFSYEKYRKPLLEKVSKLYEAFDANDTDVFNVTLIDLVPGTFSYFWWAYGNGTDEFLQIMFDMLELYKTLLGATMLNGTVDAPGVASSGTLGVISALLTQMGTDATDLQTQLGNIKV